MTKMLHCIHIVKLCHDYILEIRVGSTIHKCRNCGHTLKVITDVQVITNVEGPDA